MKNLTFTQLTVLDIKRLFREELEEFFRQAKTDNSENEMGGIELAIRITKLSKPTIYGLVSKRKIPHSKQGKRLYFSRKDLLEWIENGKRKTETEISNEAENYHLKY